MSMGLHLFLLILAALAAVVSIVEALTAAKTDRGFGLWIFLFLLNTLMAIYWTIEVYNDMSAPENKVVTIKTNTLPKVDYVVTNNTDTLYVYTFNKNEIKK